MVDNDPRERTIFIEATELLRRVGMHRKGETKALDALEEKLKELAKLREVALVSLQTGSETNTPRQK